MARGAAAVGLVSLAAGVALGWTVTNPGQGPLRLGSGTASELSGIAYAGGNSYYAVSDDDARVYPLTVTINPQTGWITDSTVGEELTLHAGSDLEGIAVLGDTLAISDEQGPAIRIHKRSNGNVVETLTLPSVFRSSRHNLGLEALSASSTGGLWTANEEALSVDGAVASFTLGTVVRLQRFDSKFKADGQWAYITDSIPGDFLAPGRDVERSGVSDLLALPNGDLLVLERALGAQTLFRSQLQQVSFAGATDTSALTHLDSAPFVAVSKALLWEEVFQAANFEGAALGRRLSNGDYSVVLVSDDGSNLEQALLALRLSTCDPTPRQSCRTAAASRVRIRSAGSKSRLSWAWRRGTIAAPTPFGTPQTTTAYALCVYDSSGSTTHLAATARIEPGAAWRQLRSGTLRYRDRSASADGVTSITLKPGNGTARTVLSARGSNLRITAANGSAPLLRRDPFIVVQLVNQETPSECFEATYTGAELEQPDRFASGF